MKFTSVLAAGTAAVLALGLTACGSSDDGDGGGTEDLTITMLPKNLGNPYFEVVDGGRGGGGRGIGAPPSRRSAGTPPRPTPRCRSSTRPRSRASARWSVSANDPTAIGDALQRGAGTRAPRWSRSTRTPSRSSATCSSTRPRPRASRTDAARADLRPDRRRGRDRHPVGDGRTRPTRTPGSTLMEEQARVRLPGHRAGRGRSTATTTTRRRSTRPRRCCSRTPT